MMDSESDEERLLKLFERTHVELGGISPNEIKAWFDTDCADLLRWLCDNITEDCYIAPHERQEFLQLPKVLTHDEIDEKFDRIRENYPGLCDVESNIFDIENCTESIELLEEQLKHCDHQIEVNKKLHLSLLEELDEISKIKLQSEVDLDIAQKQCVKQCVELDNINKQMYYQLNKYNENLEKYENCTTATFINNIDIQKIENKLGVIRDQLTNISVQDCDESTVMSSIDSAYNIEERIHSSYMKSLVKQLEIKGVQSVLEFFDKLQNNFYGLSNENFISLSYTEQLEQLQAMMNIAEKRSLDLAQDCISDLYLRSIRTIYDSRQSKLDFLESHEEALLKILIHLTLLYNLCLQEKLDLETVHELFKKVIKYVKNNLNVATSRQEEMLKIIDSYKEYCLLPCEKQIPFLQHFSKIVLEDDTLPILKIAEEIIDLRQKLTFRRKTSSQIQISDFMAIRSENRNTFQNFLISETTSQIVYFPYKMKMSFKQLENILKEQDTLIKFGLKTLMKSKQDLTQNRPLHFRHKLWIYFMTEPEKILSFLDNIKLQLKIDH